MTDLERFFQRLVERLAATDPARLHRPIELDEIMHVLVPYRANRRTLGVDTSEEYELVVMRLCAGEGGLARAEPEEARARFVRELASANPDLAALHSFESVLITLRPEPLSRALGPAETSLEMDTHDVLSLPEIPGLEALRAAHERQAEEWEPVGLGPEADEPERLPNQPVERLARG